MARRYKYSPPKGPKPPKPVKTQKPRINKTVVAIFVFLISAGLLGSTILWSLPNGSFGGRTSSAGTPASAQTIKALQDAVYKNPDDLNAVVNLGNALFDNKQYQLAIEQYENAIRKGLKSENVFGDLATAYFYTGQADKAIENARKALEINPDFSIVNINLAIYLAEGKGDYQGAVAQLEKYLQKDKNNQQAQELLKQYKAQLSSRK